MDGKNRKYYSIWIGLLTFSAGLTNGEAAWGAGLAVSHHTGNLTQLAAAFRLEDFSFVFMLAGLILCFFAGSVLAGAVFYGHEAGLSTFYGFFSLIQGTLTVALPFILPSAWFAAFYFYAALALGMQNSILLKYKGALTRTSHMTGYLTDADRVRIVGVNSRTER
ncbi:MAG TPA: DUF1275 domain-containing protein [Clostridiaceae bacterium]|nr:DUF1275 domain-containing protein [Clostridiaceae bacterium]